jgi:hypothetical protein
MFNQLCNKNTLEYEDKHNKFVTSPSMNNNTTIPPWFRLEELIVKYVHVIRYTTHNYYRGYHNVRRSKNAFLIEWVTCIQFSMEN